MSEIARVIGRGLVTVTMAVALTGAPLAAPAAAQTAAEWSARTAEATARARELRAAYDAATLARDSGSAILEVEGIRVRYAESRFEDGDTARIAEGIRRGVARLRERFGDEARRLTDTLAWHAYAYEPRQLGPAYIDIVTAAGFEGRRTGMFRPVDREAVARLVVHRAGELLRRRHRDLAIVPGSDLITGLGDREWRMVGRELGLSWSAAGRRCATGRISDCELILGPYDSVGSLARYFDRTDYRAIVATGQFVPGVDSSAFASKRRCSEGADTACARVVGLMRPRDPISRLLRETLAVHAFELAGPESVGRLPGAPSGDFIGTLAHVAGIPRDSLVRSWHARVLASRRAGVASMPVAGLTTLAWCGLALFGVARRRPL